MAGYNKRGSENTNSTSQGTPHGTPHGTPMMRQYLSIKDQYPDAILMYRMGDFYEMFYEDSIIASKALDLTLTSRNKNSPDPVPMCGIPHHAAIGYISRLIEQGFKVAVCEQMEDPSKVKGLVKREVVRVITPGVIINEENLDAKANNFLVAVVPLDENKDSKKVSVADVYGIAVMDASTGEFKGTRVTGDASLAGELFRLEPKELIIDEKLGDSIDSIAAILPTCYVSRVDSKIFEDESVKRVIAGSIGLEDGAELYSRDPLLFKAAGAVLNYLLETRPKDTLPPVRFSIYDIADFMIIDEATKTHLELVKTADGNKKGSLLWLLDKTETSMGGRMLRFWINYPLCDPAAVKKRLSKVELFYNNESFTDDFVRILSEIADIERIGSRISMGAATPRDLAVLRDSLNVLPDLNDLIRSCPEHDAAIILGEEVDTASDLYTILEKALVPETPVSQNDGGIFKEGFNKELDDFKDTLSNAKNFISDLEIRERKRTGINSLKVNYNKVFGYFIFITNANLKNNNLPDDYIRKQTLVNGERYITKELQEWESKILTADEKRKTLEKELFIKLIDGLKPHVPRFELIANRVASLDCVSALSKVARSNNYVKPTVNNKGQIDIKDGRHPLVESIFSKVPFVPNDIYLDEDKQRLMIITGPNMAGKSTVMRQVALIVLMAQMGSYVPALSADLPIIDRLFTRVGASDNIARGESTFMVEMNETSTILRQATRNSLVILDEVGRGTSTFDGLSIAWSVGEYLHDAVKCKTMFATHYHELVDLGNILSGAANYHVAAREYESEVVFLRKLIEGGTSHSFGIQVASMAGLPEIVVSRSKEILESLEKEDKSSLKTIPEKSRRTPQLDLFLQPPPSEAEKIIKEIDVNRITPIEALSLLTRLKEIINK
ncbi:MAG: DNA mismatch repair protein MutS [Deltaproteobacteria bacterium]|nr:DNA mismatch repair protein MutS [Deltaproteobacteria bacterium]